MTDDNVVDISARLKTKAPRIPQLSVNGMSCLDALVRHAELKGLHVTIFKFSRGWKVVYGTPNLVTGERGQLLDMPAEMSLDEAARYALINQPSFKER